MTTAPQQLRPEGTASGGNDSGTFCQRLLDALAECISEDIYPKATVADIVRRVRTSRRRFYENFPSKEDCFVALHTDSNGRFIRQIYAAVDRSAPWETQVRQAVEAWITAAGVHTDADGELDRRRAGHRRCGAPPAARWSKR